MTKTILILANSIRSSNRCIAGREATYDGQKWIVSTWIRPVSANGDGEVSPIESQCSDGSQPAVLDVMTVPLVGPVPCSCQPENYHIDSTQRWIRAGQVSQDVSQIVEHPTSLWFQPGTKADRIHSTAIQVGSGFQSLYLIRPEGLKVRIWTEMNQFRGGQHKQRRALFQYVGEHYELSITDPSMDYRYFNPFPALGQPPRDIVPKAPDRSLLVVSLAHAPLNGYHYKVVATVLEY